VGGVRENLHSRLSFAASLRLSNIVQQFSPRKKCVMAFFCGRSLFIFFVFFAASFARFLHHFFAEKTAGKHRFQDGQG
jgi:hypothetical protein